MKKPVCPCCCCNPCARPALTKENQMAIKITTFETRNWTTDTFTYVVSQEARRSLTTCLQALLNLDYTVILREEDPESMTRTFIAQHDTEPNRQIVVTWLD